MSLKVKILDDEYKTEWNSTKKNNNIIIEIERLCRSKGISIDIKMSAITPFMDFETRNRKSQFNERADIFFIDEKNLDMKFGSKRLAQEFPGHAAANKLQTVFPGSAYVVVTRIEEDNPSFKHDAAPSFDHFISKNVYPHEKYIRDTSQEKMIAKKCFDIIEEYAYLDNLDENAIHVIGIPEEGATEIPMLAKIAALYKKRYGEKEYGNRKLHLIKIDDVGTYAKGIACLFMVRNGHVVRADPCFSYMLCDCLSKSRKEKIPGRMRYSRSEVGHEIMYEWENRELLFTESTENAWNNANKNKHMVPDQICDLMPWQRYNFDLKSGRLTLDPCLPLHIHVHDSLDKIDPWKNINEW